jgi:N,N'-diacetylchitobiose transport system permease protein
MSSSIAALAASEAAAAVEAPRQLRGLRSRPPKKRRNLAPLWLLSPAGLVLIGLTAAPIVLLVLTSFTDYGRRSLFTGRFANVGLSQYTKILQDPDFLSSLVRTLVFTAALVVGSVAIGMAMSHLMTRLGRLLRTVVTVVLVFAWAVPNVASAMVWSWLFQPGYGVVNWFATKLQVFGDMSQTNWVQDPILVYVAIWLLVVWQAVPFIALTLYAAESQQPAEYLEAARLDGASEWNVYRRLTVSYLKPTLMVTTMLSIIWDFNVFNQIWLLSQGGPDNGSTTLGVWTYKTAFVGFNIGEGAAIAVVTTVLLMGFTAFYIRNLLRSGEDL